MSEYGTPCEDCVRCSACPEIAYCLSQPGTRPCSHDRALCGDCLEECRECADAMLTLSLQAAFARFDGDPFRQAGDDADPLAARGDQHRTFNTPWRERVRADQKRGLA